MIVFVITFGLVAFPVSVQMGRGDAYRADLQVTVGEDELIPKGVLQGNKSYSRIQLENEGIQIGKEGLPEVPKLERWLIVDDKTNYKMTVEQSVFREYKNITLFPVQPDHVEDVPEAEFTINKAAYLQNKWYGKDRAVLRKKIKLGSLTIQPITIYPAAYNPRSKTLRVYTDFKIKYSAQEIPTNVKKLEVSSFALEQAKALTLNADAFLANQAINTSDQKKYLILYAKGYETYARELGDVYLSQSVSVEYAESANTTEAVKKQIQDKYNSGGLDAVLFYADETKIPLKDMSGYKGDFYYSLVSGTDKVSDVAISRLPVKNENQAKLINNKIKRYQELQKLGHVNKRVMLVAHKENYPGKYTANMEAVRKLPNPRAFEYKTQYGGENATSSTVVNESQGGYAIINYRGHGSNTAWSSWGKDGKSFALTEVERLPNEEKMLPFIFNVACYNGSIQSSSVTLAEKQLFPSEDASDLRGAVATFGASDPSLTDVNHRFDINLFTLLETSNDLTIGNIYTAANNKLTKDAGGTPPSNVMMYMLFADPLLKPWVE